MTGKNPFGIPQASNPEWFKVEARATAEDEPSSADVYVYDVIDSWFGIDANQFVQAIAGLDVDQINLFVNSPGGVVYDAVAMTNALRRSDARVVATVDGLAASSASFLLTAADEVVMSPNAEIMIHDAWGVTIGNAADHQKNLDQLNRLSDNIASMYAGKAGGSTEDWRAIMRDEQWYSAEEAVAAGLADRIAEPEQQPAENNDVKNRFDLSFFAHAGRADAPNPVIPRRYDVLMRHDGDVGPASIIFPLPRDQKRPEDPDAVAHDTHTEGVELMPDITSRIREKLGFSAEAELDEDAVLDAIDRLAAPKNTLPEGTRVIDEAQYADLVAAAEEGRQARAQQIQDRRESVVDKAISDGKVPPARRDHWLNLMEKDEEGTTEWLDKLEVGAVVPVKAAGYTGGVDEAPDDDEERVYNELFHKTAKTEA